MSKTTDNDKYDELDGNNEVIPKLLEDGPQSSHNQLLRSISPNVRRKYNIAKVHFTTTHAKSTIGKNRAVYYLVDEHDPKEVVRTYLEVNKDELGPCKGMLSQKFGNNSSKLQEAFREVADEFDFIEIRRGSECQSGIKSNRTCPFCNETVRHYREHLPCNESP